MNEKWTVSSLANAIRILATQRDSGFLVPLAADTVAVLKSIEPAQLAVLPGKGLAHDHVLIADTQLLLRIPKQSQMRLSASANLHYQMACFERMQSSLHTPICYAVIPPSSKLQMGALLVQKIRGRYVESAADFQLIAKTLASIHRLPLVSSDARAPLTEQKNPMSETLSEVEKQAAFLAQANLNSDSKCMIKSELQKARDDVRRLPRSSVSLISFDAHPGNFLIDGQGKAILVDLDKARYSGCGLDLAHATLYTSTTWDTDINIRLSLEDINEFYATWSVEVGKTISSRAQSYLIPMRRLMWLWSVTWCAKWQVQSRLASVNAKHTAKNTEDWSIDNYPEQLIQHVDDRVNHYLQRDVIQQVLLELHTG